MQLRSAAMLCAFAATVSLAGSPATAQEGWDKDLSFYLWAISLDGTQVVRGRAVEVDTSFGDTLEDLKMAFTTHFEAKKDPWMILFDVNYGKIGPDTPDLIEDLDVEFAFVELAGGYRISAPLHVLFGARYVTLDVDVRFAPLPPLPLPTSVQGSQDWIDPYVGLRLELPISEKWNFLARSDLGGFGVGSEFAWNVAVLLERDLTRRSSLIFGAGLLDIDYEDGSGSDLFAYDVRHQGMIAALNFSF